MIISGDDPVSKGAQRFEVFTGAGKRREWPPELKASIVAECCPGRGGVSAVARRHGLDPSQIYGWRKDLRKQLEAKGLSILSAEPETAMFVPAVIGAVTSAEPAPRRRSQHRRRANQAAVELEIDGVAVKIGRDADAGIITAVIEALRAPR
jgi:transposase